jgi:hypothetical protein
MLLTQNLVHPPQKGDRFEILPTTMHVRQPLPRLTTVVSIQHRGHGIDPQAVDPVALDPEQGIADQIITDFATTEVIDQRAPVLMHAFAWIGMLIKRRTVETTETMLVGGEMRGHPVNDDAQSGRVAGTDEVAETGRVTMARGRGVKPQGLVTPRTIEGMLRYRQQFQMRESQIDHIRNQRFGQPLPVRKAAIVRATPGGQMHLINRKRRAQFLTRRHRLRLHGLRQRTDDRRRGWPHLALEAVGIGLEWQQTAIAGAYFVLVAGPGRYPRQENFPDAAFPPQAHRMPTTVPGIEVADDTDALRIRRPDGKNGTRNAVDLTQMRPEAFEGAQVRAFGQ